MRYFRVSRYGLCGDQPSNVEQRYHVFSTEVILNGAEVNEEAILYKDKVTVQQFIPNFREVGLSFHPTPLETYKPNEITFIVMSEEQLKRFKGFGMLAIME